MRQGNEVPVPMAERARAHAVQFDRTHVFDRLLERLTEVTERELSPI